jgi:hypothetical protein
MRSPSPFEGRLRTQLVTAISRYDPAPKKRRVALVSAVTLALVTTAAFGTSSFLRHRDAPSLASGASSRSQGEWLHGLLLPDMASGAPYPDARTESLEEAEKELSFPFVRPHSDLANDGTAVRIWVSDAQGGEAAIDYESGIRVYVNQVTFDPESFFQEQQSEGVDGEVIEINGNPAFAIPADDSRGSLAAVEVVVNGVDVVILAREGDHSMSDLLDVAATL